MSNYSNLENLSDKEVLALYDESVMLSLVQDDLYIECSNGYKGYCKGCGYNGFSGFDFMRERDTFYTDNRVTYGILWFCCKNEGFATGYFASSRNTNSCDPYSPYIK